jgi:hypothetical protein
MKKSVLRRKVPLKVSPSKGLSSKIVDHYINLAEKSAASGDKASAGKWASNLKRDGFTDNIP